jgi:hypothetical protein
VVRSALQNAASIASLLLTTHQLPRAERDRRSRFRALRSPRPRGEVTHPLGSRPAPGGAQAPFDDLSGMTEPHDAVATPTRKFTRDWSRRCSARGPPNLEALLDTVEVGQKRTVKKGVASPNCKGESPSSRGRGTRSKGRLRGRRTCR